MSLSDSPLCTFSSLASSLLLEKFWVQQWQGEDRAIKTISLYASISNEK